MDNLCHTLVGAAFGEAGLKRRTRFASATLMIASNLPDVDVLAFATSTPAVALRRGWTHGVVGQLLLPVVLTAVVAAVGRRRTIGASTRVSDSTPVRVSQLLLLSYVGVVTHVLMDWLNTYGVRFLMPVDSRWFYGDTLFIIDPWMWLILAAGVVLARRYGSTRSAGTALVLAVVYVLAMVASARAARQEIVDRWQQVEGRAPRALMVGPIPVTPFTKDVIIDAGDHYERGEFRWRPRSVRFSESIVAKHDQDPLVAQAREAPNIRAFLVWSRFPYWTIEPVAGGTRVTVGDMRFGGGRGLAARNFTESVVLAARPETHEQR